MDYLKIINSSNIRNNVVGTATTQGEKMSSIISDATKDFMRKISNSTTEDILKFLDIETKQIATRGENYKLYRYRNILMSYSDGQTAYNLEQNLESVKKFGISPKFAGYFRLSKDKFLTIMEANSEKILPYSRFADKISAKTKQNFKNSFLALVKNGIVNKEALANKDSLLVSSNGKQIIIADWNEIVPLTIDKQTEFIKIINDWKI